MEKVNWDRPYTDEDKKNYEYTQKILNKAPTTFPSYPLVQDHYFMALTIKYDWPTSVLQKRFQTIRGNMPNLKDTESRLRSSDRIEKTTIELTISDFEMESQKASDQRELSKIRELDEEEIKKRKEVVEKAVAKYNANNYYAWGTRIHAEEDVFIKPTYKAKVVEEDECLDFGDDNQYFDRICRAVKQEENDRDYGFPPGVTQAFEEKIKEDWKPKNSLTQKYL